MIDGKRTFRRILICLIVMLAFQVAAAPVLQMNSTVAWAKSKKKTKKKTKAKTKKKKTGFVKKNGNWYFLKDGKRQTGWITFKGRRYFAYKKGSRKGRLVRGWFKRGKKEYYFRETGKKRVVCSMAIDCTVKINGIKCIFDEDGNFVKCKYAGKKNGFINTVGEMARLNQVRNNILASLVVAQACVETGFGANVYRNNLFGIYHGNSYGSYSSWEESLEDYVDFMHTYIPSIFGVRDWSTACYIVGHSGYAAASNYYSALVSVVQSNNLTRFDK